MKSKQTTFVAHRGAKSVMYLFLTTVVFLVVGCGTLTEEQLDAREYRRINFEAEFKDFRRQCFAAGMRIYIDAKQKVGRDGVPKRGDRYFCA